MQRQILTYPDPFLATKALPVHSVDGKVRELVRDMFDTMYASNGIGLAAPQIGVGKRVIVVDISPVEEKVEPIALVNPEIVGKQGQVEGMEGCLSVPGIEGMVCRGESVTVQGKNESGDPVTIEASGLLSRVLQHEIDHLDGVLFIDRLSSPTASAK
ncbi:MAG: peptide deformylase [Deltaproteobacteria bacterium]|nr:peptide deformylase [Deltaproteobacteria bacterium]